MTLVVGVAGTTYAVEQAWVHRPYLQLGYVVTSNGREAANSLDCPSVNDGVTRKWFRTARGDQFEARLCFPGVRIEARKYQIYIPQGNGKPVAHMLDTPEAEQAMRNFVEEQFRLTPEDLTIADAAYTKQRDAERWEKMFEITTLVALYVSAMGSIGWVIRGFLDIPYRRRN